MKNFIQDKMPLSTSGQLTLFSRLPAITRWFIQRSKVLILNFLPGQPSFAGRIASRLQSATAWPTAPAQV